MLIDKFGRKITYARISVTDRCNLRCFYCMPAEGINYSPRKDLLSYEEIIRLGKILGKNGVSKIRITGGEPFARKDLIDCLRSLKQIVGIEEVHVTTNAVLIAPFIHDLASIGIDSINVSLDTTDSARFYEITRRDEFEAVWNNLHALIDCGIPTKVNIVVMKGINEGDIIPMANLSKTLPISIRYIEEMPFNGSEVKHEVITYSEIQERLNSVYPNIERLTEKPGSTSMKFKIPGSKGDIGIIAAYSRTFCNDCNRIRITSKGELRNCLYDHSGISLRDLLRENISDAKLIEEIQAHLNKKMANGFEAENNRSEVSYESMSIIGG
ncbi:GTP 3',8-cyclase MoaA [Fulvivirga lutea]|uniref:GTP 3',8-cyclase n=1 Tax=Fulvivirga lutea TaxID=2810512 RepID=A0A974WIJ8_9BACT|nr:GTP 3',8-cyclase MoaA [Fulvivirga lutea]QSE96003.1 GTP 3',8-cyclase MoaA [Fulvivirga lutea]